MAKSPPAADLQKDAVRMATMVPLASIVVPIETRGINQQHVKDLADSIEANGLQSPIQVFQRGGEYVLGYGRHRYEAHKLLGLNSIAAHVLVYVSDEQVRLAQAIENLQRKDMTPLEEAESCQVILEAELAAAADAKGASRLGNEFDKQALAEKRVALMLGVTVKWLQGRLALNRLSPRVQQMIRDGLLHTAHGQVLARLVSHEKQEELAGRACATKLQWGDRKGELGEPMAVHELKDRVEDEMRTLHDVNWKLEVEFAGKPACSTCASNSANAPGLFEGGEEKAADDSPKRAQCLNGECYAEKRRVAGLAVRKASNTLVKLGLPKSPANAEKAMVEREVPFVRTAAVVSMAKAALEPTKKTPAEKRGQQDGQRANHANQQQQEAQNRFRSAHFDWENEAERKIATLLRSDRNMLIMALLLPWMPGYDNCDPPLWRNLAKYQIKQARESMMATVNRFSHALEADIEAMAGEVYTEAQAKEQEDTWPLLDVPQFVLQTLVTVLKPDLSPEPKLEDFLPKEKPAAEVEAKPKKKGKKKNSRKAVMA